MRIILQTLFIIILANILSAQDPVDTTIVISGLSDISALDSKYPLIGNISPNSGESYNSGENISVIWDASDDSFTDNCISIFISYNLGENFNNIFENINNVGQTNYQLADINSQFVRLKIQRMTITEIPARCLVKITLPLVMIQIGILNLQTGRILKSLK